MKKQKAHRRRSTAATTEAIAISQPVDSTQAGLPDSTSSAVASGSGKTRPKVANTVARIEQGLKRFTLSGSGLGQVLRFVLAFLLHNQLQRNGMSWSTAGSHALTALSVLISNSRQAIWVREHTIPLRFVGKAA